MKQPYAKVSNIISPNSGRGVANQFSIDTNDACFFQSYDSLCARWDGEVLTLGRHWDYSNTTRRWLYEWLRDHGVAYRLGFDLNSKGITKAIEQGIIRYDEDMC